MTYLSELTASVEAAIKAGAIQMENAKKGLRVETKADHSPVTNVDKACEAIIRDILLSRFPSDGFLGEETGTENGTSGRRWIVDPLDGTRPYIRGIPTHSVLIALEADGEPVAGVMHLPALNRTYRAARGEGAFVNDRRLHVSTTPTLAKAMGSGLGFLEMAGTPSADSLLRVMKSWDYAYGFMDAFSYGCLADGSLDVCVNLLDKPWDCAAAACIVSEAGGRYSDLSGNKSIYSGAIVLSNGILHDSVLEYFSGLKL